MASGASITITGGTNMTQVVTGDVIDNLDFNNARLNVNRLLGNATDVTLGSFSASSTYGWAQGGVGVNAASEGALVLAAGSSGAFKELQDDVQAMCLFLGQSLRAGVGSDVTTSTIITAATWSNLMLNIKDCWDNRFSPASRTASTDASASRTSAWTNTLSQLTTWTFSSEGAARAFFNGGGAVGVSASRTGGTSSTQNTQWTSKLTNISDIWLYNDRVEASAGTASGVGFYELTTSYKQLIIYYGGASPYTSDYIKVEAKVNSTTNPTVISVLTTLVDAGDNVIDASVDGTLTIRGRRNQPDANGSGFSFSAPSCSAGSISGS